METKFLSRACLLKVGLFGEGIIQFKSKSKEQMMKSEIFKNNHWLIEERKNHRVSVRRVGSMKKKRLKETVKHGDGKKEKKEIKSESKEEHKKEKR